MIKMLIVQNLGCILGSVDYSEHASFPAITNAIKIDYPMMMTPSESGSMAISVNPMFRDTILINPTYIVAEAPVVERLADEYNRYVSEKKTGILMPPKIKLAT